MPLPAEAVRAGFLRQRRALMATSLVLFAYEVSGIRLDHISVLGNQFEVTRPELVTAGVWLTWVYFLARCFQYFKALPEPDLMELVEARYHSLIGLAARDKFCKEFKRAGTPPGKVRVVESELEPVGKTPDGDLKFRFLNGNVGIKTGKQTMWTGAQGENVQLPFKTVQRCRISAWAYALVITHGGTEYVLPFLVAAAPVLWLLFEKALNWK